MKLWPFKPHASKAPNQVMPVLTSLPTEGPVYPRADFLSFAEQGYKRNELVFAAVRVIADNFSAAPLRVYDASSDEEIERHPVRALIRRPNPFESESEFWRLSILYLYLSGNLFVEKVRDRAGRIVELWPLRPDRVKIVASPANYIAGYVYTIAGRDFPLDTADVVHFKFADPTDDYFGISPLRAALRQVAVDNEATDFSKVLLQNRGVPGIGITTQQAIDETIAQRLIERFRQKFSGDRRGEPILLQQGMDIKTIALNMDELAFADLRAISETRILSVFGVPPILVAAKAGLDRSTFANFQEARRSFYQDVIQSLQWAVADKLEAGVLREFDPPGALTLGFDSSEVAALAELRQQGWDNAQAGVAGGWVRVNEARALVGLPRDPAGDVYLRALGMVSVAAGKGEKPPTETIPQITPAADRFGNLRKSVDQPKAGRMADLETMRTIVAGRNLVADKFLALLQSALQDEFVREAAEVMQALEREHKALGAERAHALLSELAQLETAWRARAAKAIAPIHASLAAEAGELAAAELGAGGAGEGAALFASAASAEFAALLSAASARDVRAVIARAQDESFSIEELRAALRAKFDHWDAARTQAAARAETDRAANAAALDTYKRVGVTRKAWAADSDPCPECRALDGRTAALDENFDGAIAAPPAHPNCRCAVRAEVE